METVIDQAGGRQGSDHGRCARHRHHAQTGGAHGVDDARARVGHGGRAGVRHQRNALAGLQPGDQLVGDFPLVVLVRGDQRSLQAVARQQLRRIARVLAGDGVGQRQHMERAQADVGCISDGCGQHI